VACGFALYLNKRTWLEGWDLENGLKRIGLRRRKIKMTPAVILLTGFLAGFMIPEPASAYADQESVRQQTLDIVASEEFMPITVVKRWQLSETSPDENDDNDSSNWLSRFLSWLMTSNHTDSSTPWYQRPEDWIRLLLWSITLAFLGWLVWRYRHWLSQINFQRSSPPTALMVAGLDLHESPLPDDIPAAIREALQQNNVRLALSTLYRATLLSIHQHTPIPPGLTEQECLHHLRTHYQGRTDTQASDIEILSQLTPLWSRHAWGHQPIAIDSIEQLTRRFENELAPQGGVSS